MYFEESLHPCVLFLLLSAVWLAAEINFKTSIAEGSRSALSHMQPARLSVHGQHADHFIPESGLISAAPSSLWLHRSQPQIPQLLAIERDNGGDVWAP